MPERKADRQGMQDGQKKNGDPSEPAIELRLTDHRIRMDRRACFFLAVAFHSAQRTQEEQTGKQDHAQNRCESTVHGHSPFFFLEHQDSCDRPQKSRVKNEPKPALGHQ